MQPILSEGEKRPAGTIAEQRDRDDHIGEMVPLRDREEPRQQHLIGEEPRRGERNCDEQHASPALCP